MIFPSTSRRTLDLAEQREDRAGACSSDSVAASKVSTAGWCSCVGRFGEGGARLQRVHAHASHGAPPGPPDGPSQGLVHGASDWFNYGHQTHATIEFIQRQGRWNSTAFRIYIRLRGDAIASVMDEVFAAASADEEHAPVQSAGARRTPIVRSDQMLAALRADHRASMAAQQHQVDQRAEVPSCPVTLLLPP